MKKAYESPVAVEEQALSVCSFCQTSPGCVTGDNGIGSGGIDEEGEMDPDAKVRDCWKDGLW